MIKCNVMQDNISYIPRYFHNPGEKEGSLLSAIQRKFADIIVIIIFCH